MPARGMIRHRSTEMVYANPAAAEGFMLLTGENSSPMMAATGSLSALCCRISKKVMPRSR